MNRTNYLVEQMASGRKWRTVYDNYDSDGMQPELNRLEALNVARGLATREPEKRVRITESEFRNGRLASLTEYGVNPPHWSGNAIPPRGPEIYIRSEERFPARKDKTETPGREAMDSIEA